MDISSIKKLTDYPHLNLYRTTYTDRLKKQKQWIFASRSDRLSISENRHYTADAVVIVPFHIQQKKLVVIKEFRVALGTYQYGFPAGLVDDGESAHESGIRELFEETGLEIVRVLKKSPVVFSSSGLTDESIRLIFVECKGVPSNQHNEASEEIDVLMLSQKEAETLLEDGRIKFDIKTWIVLDRFASTGMI